ncbi:FkbM family methyltransferase [Bacillus fengqiuensis]|nr:FkbM family methyltransferase [Bacillus fengqiuensis]
MQYYSQYAQDKYLNEQIFNGKKRGFFVDIGAHDGVSISNTYFFEKFMDWDGICIEPLPHIFKQLRKNRKCLCLDYAISTKVGYEEFLSLEGYTEMLSGLVDNYDKKHLNRIDNELQFYGGNKRIIKVKTSTLQSILDANRIHHIDFCSIDTEGSELKVVQSIDFNKVNIECLVIENNYNDNRVSEYLKTKNYILKEKLIGDEIFIKKG